MFLIVCSQLALCHSFIVEMFGFLSQSCKKCTICQKQALQDVKGCIDCGSQVCKSCISMCAKQDCEGTYCMECVKRGENPHQYCFKCRECWICGMIPFSSQSQQFKQINNLNVILCGQHSKSTLISEYLESLEIGQWSGVDIDEARVKKELRRINKIGVF